MSGSNEFVIDQQKRQIVVESLNRIERLFSVEVSFTNGGSADRMLWVVLKGQEDKRTKAKVCFYIFCVNAAYGKRKADRHDI